MERDKHKDRRAEWAEEVGTVNFDLLMGFVEEGIRAASKTDLLIDRFLQIKDLRIEVEESGEYEETPTLSPSVEITQSDIESEELARIYQSQGLYREANEIYNKLFLLYSEKIAYFASQIESLSSMESRDK